MDKITSFAVQLFRKRDRTSKTKIFFSFLKKLGGAKSKKLKENFSVLELKFPQNFRAEAERNETLSQRVSCLPAGRSSKKVRASLNNHTNIKLSEISAVFSAAICKNRHCFCGVARALRAARMRFASRAIC